MRQTERRPGDADPNRATSAVVEVVEVVASVAEAGEVAVSAAAAGSVVRWAPRSGMRGPGGRAESTPPQSARTQADEVPARPRQQVRRVGRWHGWRPRAVAVEASAYRAAHRRLGTPGGEVGPPMRGGFGPPRRQKDQASPGRGGPP
jgi:hypothetical protein